MARKKILLVDDSNTALMLEKMILNGAHYDLLTAKDGLEGVEKAIAEKPDLILMDLVMPRLDGFEACKRLRENEVTKKIPIIMVTTKGEAENREIGFKNGCSDFVTKPFNNSELLVKVKKLLGG